jgi:FRG domain
MLLIDAGTLYAHGSPRYDRMQDAMTAETAETCEWIPQVRPHSWNDLLDALYEGSWDEALGRFRAKFAFRGMSDSCFTLRTSLARLGGNAQVLETAMLRAIRRYAPAQSVPDRSVWNWLALAQHHHLPTRLLDWSYSPFVALHFATENIDHYERDGVVLTVDFSRTNESLPEKLKRSLETEDTYVFNADMLQSVSPILSEFDTLSDDPFLAFFEPPSFDERIVNQYALFSLPSDPNLHLDAWLQAHPAASKRIIVPSELKWEIRDKLDQANVTERVLYPGLDGLGRWLTRYYTPRKNA